MVDCMSILMDGNLIGAITCPFTNSIGGWFYVLALMAVELAIYIKFENITAPAMLGTVFSVLMIFYMPVVAQDILILIAVGNIVALIYNVLTKN